MFDATICLMSPGALNTISIQRHHVADIHIEDDGDNDAGVPAGTGTASNPQGKYETELTTEMSSAVPTELAAAATVSHNHLQILAWEPRSFMRSAYDADDNQIDTQIEEVPRVTTNVRSIEEVAPEDVFADAAQVHAARRAYRRMIGEGLNAEAEAARAQEKTRQQLSSLARLLSSQGGP
jgi:hypothetical protein